MQVIGWALAVGVTLFVAGAQNPLVIAASHAPQ